MSTIVPCAICSAPRGLKEVCRPCANRRNAGYKARNREKIKIARSAYKRALHASRAGERAEKKAKRRAPVAARRKAARAAWKLRNRGAVNESTARRFATKLRATPAWADKKLMKDFYTLAVIYTEELKRPCHVDHLVPLRSKLVCGLHAPANLSVKPGGDNIAKGNRYWPEMP